MEQTDKTTSGNADAKKNNASPNRSRPQLSRRDFLKTVGLTAAGLAGMSAVGGCEVIRPQATEMQSFTTDRVPISVQYPAVPYTPVQIPVTGSLQFFTPHEAQTVEAFTARLLPGTPEDPGAREAGVVYYIDSLMAYPDGFAEPVYRKPPFAATYTEDEPPDGGTGTDRVIWVPADEIERYGYQSILTPREVMRIGLAALDRYANGRFDEDFVDLTEEQQDQIIEAMVEEEAEGFEPLAPKSFFHAMRRYTSEGMFSDPVYGGNRDMVGWRLVGFPGAQRAYPPDQIRNEGIGRAIEPWSIAQMPPFNPGQAVGPWTVLPVTGSEEHLHDAPPEGDFHRPFQQDLYRQQIERQPPAPPGQNFDQSTPENGGEE